MMNKNKDIIYIIMIVQVFKIMIYLKILNNKLMILQIILMHQNIK